MNLLLGLNKVWDFLSGYKTYIAGTASLLTGLGGLLGELVPLISNRNAMAMLDWVKHLPNDQSWLLVLTGLTAIGLRHAHSKTQDAVAPK